MKIGSIELPIWGAEAAPPAGDFLADPDFLTTELPKILWIELTSKCPFDCIFCTRRTRFGAGRHLDFDVYRKLIAELDVPDFIGLNYSGESLYYPKLLDAIRLAAATGAPTELVSAFSTVSQPLLRGIVESGLDRLAISLHTMDPEQYQAIYQFGSLDLLKQRVAEFQELKAALGVQKPRLDFCFVAMRENLDQLPAVAAYARSVGAPEISIHPIIGRHLLPHDFSRELEGNQLRSAFKDELRAQVEALRSAHPGFAVNVLNPDLDVNPRLSHSPGYYSPLLPPGARIHSCDQSPFESVHILAGGNVVVCEVHDEISMGNLHEQSLREIWTGERYRDFRRQYVTGSVPECRTCVWKMAHLPSSFRAAIIAADGMSPQLLRGWHNEVGDGIVWSKRQALAALANPRRARRVKLAGLLPFAPGPETNRLTLICNGYLLGTIQNDSAALKTFDTVFTLPENADALYFEFTTSHVFRPSLYSSTGDSRDLGMGLARLEVCG